MSDNHFKISSFYPAVFLRAKGMELINIDRLTPKRCEFIFIDTPERENLLQDYNFAPENSENVLIDARKFVAAIKTLKEKLYQNSNY